MKKILFLSLALFGFMDCAVASDANHSVTQEEVKTKSTIKVLPFVKDEIQEYSSECIYEIFCVDSYQMPPPTFEKFENLKTMNPIIEEIHKAAKTFADQFFKLERIYFRTSELAALDYFSGRKISGLENRVDETENILFLRSIGFFDEEKKKIDEIAKRIDENARFLQLVTFLNEYTDKIDEIAKKYADDKYETYRIDVASLCGHLWNFANDINARCDQSKIQKMSDVFKEINRILSTWDMIGQCPQVDDLVKSLDSVSTFFLNPLEYQAYDVFYKLRNEKTFVRYFTQITRLIDTFIEINKTKDAHSDGIYLTDQNPLWRDVDSMLKVFEHYVNTVSGDTVSMYKAISILRNIYHGEGEIAFSYKWISYPNIRGLVMLINAMAVALAVTYSHNDMDPSRLAVAKYR